MIGVLIPAHNEEALIARCLESVRVAATHPALAGEPVHVVVALDRCNDRTARIARSLNADTISLAHGNVGSARAAAARVAIGNGARWLANTDADSVVPPHWLSAQLALAADGFCGMVRVDDWLDYPAAVARSFEKLHAPQDGHPHVHGANLGVSTECYRRCGGFRPLSCGEDIALVDALRRIGARIASTADPMVGTSARRFARARGGFNGYLQKMEREQCGRL